MRKRQKHGMDLNLQMGAVPIDPDANLNDKPKMSKEEILREKLIYLRRLEASRKEGYYFNKKI